MASILDKAARLRHNVSMRVISPEPLENFWQRHPDAERPLRMWYKTAILADWRSLQDVRCTYPRADSVRTNSGEALTVFNIRGNKYRLIARIRYDYRLVNVRCVMTHAKYDEADWKEQKYGVDEIIGQSATSSSIRRTDAAHATPGDSR